MRAKGTMVAKGGSSFVEAMGANSKICYTEINIGHFYHGLYLQTCRFRQKVCKKVILVIFSVRVE